MINEILEFQIYDSKEENVFSKEEDSEELLPEYIIHIFGKTIKGESVYCKVVDFTPYFFLKLPEEWNKNKAQSAINKMKKWLKSDSNKKVWPYKYKNGLLNIDLVYKKDPNGFTNDKKFLFALLIFNNDISRKKFANLFYPYNKNSNQIKKKIRIYGISTKPIHYPIYESNCPAFLRCFHLQDIKGCGWVQINKKDCFKLYNKSLCKYEFKINWKKIKPIEKEENAPLIIASFDIECNSIDGAFPQATRPGDKIIQIGTTYTRLGESKPFRQHIVCLNDTDNIEGIIVESYKNEKKLIKGWIKEIKHSDCDIITGYNIFYFDEKYIFDRCDEFMLNLDKINYLSKLKNHYCNFKQTELSSSAMGQNQLRYWETPGRVHIDLMKDIQKTFKLSSYKLDSVSSHFIRGEIKIIKKINKNKYKLECITINDIYINDYIHIEILKNFVSDNIGKKYKIIEIDEKNKNLIIETKFDILKEIEIQDKGKLFWSQAKDDIGPKDIFRLQKGSSKDRAIVAKYCVKDCRLVNLLINKLEIIGKNIQMANVCYVPLNYLFIRGQGIKLFSLCLKYFRDEGFVFPVIRKSLKKLNFNNHNDKILINKIFKKLKLNLKDEDFTKKTFEKLNKYDGAIVFDPIPSTLYEALSVKDYASLYPSSILHKNISHETKIIDKKYDNIPGLTYYDATFNEYYIYKKDENDEGTHVTISRSCRFVKKDNKYGVIPKILDTLLKERKKVKKQMKIEKNEFKKKMLDAKQLALKTTANSLYGQLGASTSSVRDSDLAACTTSTGREMLIFAQKYDEEILPWIINGLKYAKQRNDDETYNYILNHELKNNSEEIKEKINNFITEIKDITFQPIVKYGDSVIGNTPLLLKNKETGFIHIKKIKDLSNKWNHYHDGKESYEIKKYMTWTEQGWTNIKRVIRHKLNKKLLKIQTNQGIVIVTAEHSLLDNKCNILNASKLNIGTKILHNFPNNFNSNKIDFINEDIANIYGFFINNGFCNNSTIIFNCKDIKKLNNIKKLCDINFSKYKWIINNNKLELLNKNTKIYKYFIKLFYNKEKEKKIPNEILNSKYNIRKSFWNAININELIYCNETQLYLGLYYLAKSLGLSILLNNNYKIQINNNKEQYIIKNISEWELEEQYVYDLTTENHHFHAGVGSIIVHNTDSIFSCYRFRKNTGIYKKEYQLSIWKRIIEFSRELIRPFIGIEYKDLWDEYHYKYYPIDKIKKLEIRSKYKIKLKSNKELSKKDKIKQFLKEYMEEIYLPWIWTLQDLFLIEYNDLSKLKDKEDILNIRIINRAINLLESKDILQTPLTSDKTKATKLSDLKLNRNTIEFMRFEIIEKIKFFIINVLNNIWIQPYWILKKNKLIRKIKLYTKGEKIIDKTTLSLSIKLGIISGELVKSRLHVPHDLEYEKTYWPFIILTKKKYVGNKYEFNENKFYMDFMGIVLKRRDNSPIVKEICDGIITRLLNERNPEMAKNFVIKCLTNMFEGKYNIKYFLTSKTLKMKSSYKNWERIAHVVLADRIGKREPGNEPQSGDRIEYAAIKIENIKKKKILQGDRIETPKFIKENNLQIDYQFYMENQIMKPALQFLQLVIKNPEEIFNKYIINNKNQIDILKFVKKTKVKKTNIYDLFIKNI